MIATVLAALAGVLAVFYLRGASEEAMVDDDLVTTYVASEDYAPGTKGSEITASLEPQEVAADAVAPGAIEQPAEISTLVLAEPIYQGEQVTTSRFSSVQEQGIVGELTGTDRAIQVAGNQNQVLAGTLREGDKVDVVASLKYQVTDFTDSGAIAQTRERSATRIVLRDITVLQAASVDRDSSELSGNEEFSVIVSVTDEQAETLFFVEQNGEWTLQLRPVNDPEDSAPSVQTVESVLGADLGVAGLATLGGGSR
ncbi:MAG: Flp pilus assembly protein CpaB [Gaiellales bacterium]